MKPQIDFPNVAQELYEKRKHKEFLAIDKSTETNGPLWHLLFIISIGAIGGIAIVCGIILNYEKLKPVWEFMDTPAFGVIFTFVSIAGIAGWVIIKSAKRSRV